MTQMNTDKGGGEDLCSSASSMDHFEFLDLGMSETDEILNPKPETKNHLGELAGKAGPTDVFGLSRCAGTRTNS